MTKSDICIIIPIFKKTLNDFEIQSVKQCIKILSNYTIYFVGPIGMNIDFYKDKFPEIENFNFFNENYFKNVGGYSKLMLSAVFYKTFKNYEYMLIYQTDCYVFRDELLAWAKKDFDFIGGIWFEDCLGDPYKGAKLWYPGNGGLSLRKIKPILDLLSSKERLKNFKQLLIEKQRLKELYPLRFIKSLFLLPLNLLGYKNNYNYFATTFSSNEDKFFMQVSLVYKKIKTPSVEEALGFSWDRKPAFLLGVLGSLPFACHAWYREDSYYRGNKEFWLKQLAK